MKQQVSDTGPLLWHDNGELAGQVAPPAIAVAAKARMGSVFCIMMSGCGLVWCVEPWGSKAVVYDCQASYEMVALDGLALTARNGMKRLYIHISIPSLDRETQWQVGQKVQTKLYPF